MSHGSGPSDLELEIIQLCGLSKMLAPGLLRRALADVNAANPPTPSDVLRALPMIETRMRAYLPPAEVKERSAQMQRFLNGGGASAPAPASGRPSKPLVGRG